jgi:hypothetical protein
MRVDWKKLSTTDRAIVGGAGVVFIAGFLPWWGYSGPLSLYSASVDGWSAGFTAWAGTLLLFLAGVYLLIRVAGVTMPNPGIGPNLLVAAGATLGLLLVIIRWLTLPRVHAGLEGSIGARYGIWIAIIGGAVELAGAIMALRASGEALPWQQPDQA